jgi:oligopeptide/dipeptide ABC transporter ATP-binding protein
LGEPLLEVRDLIVRYGIAESRAAVDGVSFEVAASETVGLLGESACGKTTLAAALLGLVPAPGRVASGSIKLRGRELLGLPEREWERVRGAEIATIGQEPGLALNPVLRIGTQIAEVLRAHRRFDRKRCRGEAKALLDEVRLAGLYSAYPHQLSGGQRQRVLIAQALACRPAVLVADEPTAALDSILEIEILDLLHDLGRRLGVGLILISHRLSTLASLAQRVMVMYAGRIVEDGPTDRVLREPLHPYTRGLIASAPRLGGPAASPLPCIAGQPPSLGERHAGCAFEPRCPERLEVCRVRAPPRTRPSFDRGVRCFLHDG